MRLPENLLSCQTNRLKVYQPLLKMLILKILYFFFLFLVYVDIGMDSGATAKLDFTFGTSTTVSRTWEVKVTQIECYSVSRPYDSGCLQYHTGTTGRFTSFNFAQTASTAYAHLPSQK